MMRFRPQRGGLQESMHVVVNVKPTRFALAQELDVEPGQITWTHIGMDDRIGWDTWMISVDGQAVGYTDREPE